MIPFFTELITMEWRQPLWLLLALQPLLLWLVLRWLQQRNQQQFADSHLMPWIQVHKERSLWQQILSRDLAYWLAWGLFALSLAGPRLPVDSLNSQQNNQQESKLDIMMVIDLSRSMQATDVTPTRLRRATLETYELLSVAKNTRIGVVVYAARPHLFVPLTSDFNALRFYLQDLDSLQLPTLGSDAAAALNLAQEELIADKQASQQKNRKQVLLWLTDGDIDSSRVDSIEATILQAQSNDINTSILGLGTTEGSAIPLADGSWLESAGQGVVSRMDPQLLQDLSQLGKGQFSMVSDSESDWEMLYQQGMLARLSAVKNNEMQQWHELYSWFLFPAILLLIIAVLPFSWGLSRRSSSILVLFIATNLFLGNSPVYAEEAIYQDALLAGVETYKGSEYIKAKKGFIDAILLADNDDERGIALHNLGNALFQLGDYANAAVIFSDALRYIPKQKETINNQQLTIALYTVLEKRRAKSKTQGLNTPPTPNSPLLDLPDQLPFMLNSTTKNLLEFSLPKMPSGEWNSLLDKGLNHLRLLTGEGSNKNLSQRKKHQHDIEQARIHELNIDGKSSNVLWKRLFEIEEGFPAKLEKPKEVPGVKPW